MDRLERGQSLTGEKEVSLWLLSLSPLSVRPHEFISHIKPHLSVSSCVLASKSQASSSPGCICQSNAGDSDWNVPRGCLHWQTCLKGVSVNTPPSLKISLWRRIYRINGLVSQHNWAQFGSPSENPRPFSLHKMVIVNNIWKNDICFSRCRESVFKLTFISQTSIPIILKRYPPIREVAVTTETERAQQFLE